jgi:hypothetical protein
MMMPIEDAVALLCLVALIVLVIMERTLGRWLDKKASEEREERRLHRGIPDSEREFRDLPPYNEHDR